MSRAKTDLIWIVAVVIPALILASHYDVFEWLVSWTRQHEDLELDEWITLSLLLWLVFGLFALRRWKDARDELNLRIKIEEDLREAHDNLELKVEERTKDLSRLNDQLAAEIQERQSAEEQIRQLLSDNRRLNQRALSLLEDHRRELAREIHDEFGQCLTAIQIDARIASEALEAQPGRAMESVASILSVSQRMYDSIRTLAKRLRPETIDNLGLIGAIEEEVSTWRSRNVDCTYHLQIEPLSLNLPDSFVIQVYRVFQECLNNIHKHARASEIWVTLTEQQASEADELLLIVRDNGVGFDPDTQFSGLGLVGMRERAESLGGFFEINSQIGQGTEIRFRLPTNEPEQDSLA